MPLHGRVKKGWRPQWISEDFGKLATASTKARFSTTEVSKLPCYANFIASNRKSQEHNHSSQNGYRHCKLNHAIIRKAYTNIERQRYLLLWISVAVDFCCFWFLLLCISVTAYVCCCLLLLLISVAVDSAAVDLLLLLISVSVAVDFCGCWFLLLFFDCCCWFLSQTCLGDSKKRLCGQATIGLKEWQYVK